MSDPNDKSKASAATGSQARREQILDAAAKIINRRGVSSKPLADVAERLGLSRAALYYYVKDQADLVFQVYRRTCEHLELRLKAAITAGGDALEIVQHFVSGVLDPEAPEPSGLGEIGLLRDEDRGVVLDLHDAVVAQLAEVLRAGAEAGDLRTCDFDVAARTVINIVLCIPTLAGWTESILGPEQVDRRQQIALCNTILADGWMADRSQSVDVPPIDLTPVALAKVGAFDRKGLAEARREAILVAASRLFNRKGVDSTSLDEIAAALGATKRTLYQHVGDKEAIVLACVERSVAIQHYIFAAAQGGPHGPYPVLERIVRWQRGAAIAQQRSDIEPMRVVSGIESTDQSVSDHVVAAIRVNHEERLQLVSSLKAAGLMRPLGLPNSTDPLPILWNSMHWLGREPIDAEPARIERIAAEVVDLMRQGLRAL